MTNDSTTIETILTLATLATLIGGIMGAFVAPTAGAGAAIGIALWAFIPLMGGRF